MEAVQREDGPGRPARRSGDGGAAGLSARAGLLLMAANGASDAYIYIDHGRVFAEAMTGNLVLVAVGVATPAIIAFWRPLAIFAAFCLGAVLATGEMRRRAGSARLLQPLVLLAECAVFSFVALAPHRLPQLAVTVPIGLLSGLQIAVFRRIAEVQVAAIVMATNVLRATEAVYDARRSGARATLRRATEAVSTPACFTLGALLSAALTRRVHDDTGLFIAAAFLVVLVLRLATLAREGEREEPVSARR